MTAALDADNVVHEAGSDAQDVRLYPERISIRLNEPSRPLYDALEDALIEDGVAISHRVLALVSLWADVDEDTREPDPVLDKVRELLRPLVTQRAEEIAAESQKASNTARAISMRSHLDKKARRQRQLQRKGQRTLM